MAISKHCIIRFPGLHHSWQYFERFACYYALLYSSSVSLHGRKFYSEGLPDTPHNHKASPTIHIVVARLQVCFGVIISDSSRITFCKLSWQCYQNCELSLTWIDTCTDFFVAVLCFCIWSVLSLLIALHIYFGVQHTGVICRQVQTQLPRLPFAVWFGKYPFLLKCTAAKVTLHADKGTHNIRVFVWELACMG